MKLVKLSVLNILIFIICSNLSAIDEKGIKTGFNYSILTGNQTKNVKYGINFSAGLFINKRLNDWLSLQPELMFSSKGLYYDGEERILVDNDADGTFNEDPFDLLDNDGDGLIDEDRPEMDFKVSGYYKISYLEIPVLLKVSMFNFLPKEFNVMFGPSLNILLNNAYKLKQDGYEFNEGNLSNLKTFDLSAIFGFVYTPGKYKIELRINQSFISNNYKSAGQAIIESIENPEEIFGPTIVDNYLDYYKFQKINGYNTSISLLVSLLF